MTTTIHHPIPTAPTLATTDLLLAVLADALAVCAEHDDLDLHTGTAAGQSLLSLAALARQAAGGLGVEPGTPLVHGRGVVVVRDLDAATRLLARTASAAGPTAGDPAHLLPAAKALHARLLEAMTAAS